MEKVYSVVDEYTPCRISECFLDCDGRIEAVGLKGKKFQLKGVGRTIWLMLDGKHTISMIVSQVCIDLNTTDKRAIKKELLIILDALQKKEAIIPNWDPLYKSELSQEFIYNE